MPFKMDRRVEVIVVLNSLLVFLQGVLCTGTTAFIVDNFAALQ